MDQEHLRQYQLNITVNFIFSFNVSFKNISIGISILPAVCPVIACVGVGGGVPPELGKLPPPVFEMLLFTGDIWKLLLLLLLLRKIETLIVYLLFLSCLPPHLRPWKVFWILKPTFSTTFEANIRIMIYGC